MRNRTRTVAWLLVAVTGFGVMTLPGCGGGSSGGGSGGNLPGFLALSGSVFFGTRAVGGADSLQPFPSEPTTGVPVPAGGLYSVPGANFTAGTAGRQDYLQVSFNIPLDALTIFSGTTGQGDGMVITRQENNGTGGVTSTIVPFSLDPNGILDNGNAFVGPDTAPALLRVYFDSDDNLTTPESLPQGAYTLSITSSLRGFNGGQFCVNGSGSNCAAFNSYLPQFSFAIGEDPTPLTMTGDPNSGIGASNITQGDPQAPINTEIFLNFSKAVAFETLVGTTNLTTLDPFITVPFILGDNTDPTQVCRYVPPAGCPPNMFLVPPPVFGTDIGNLHVVYTAPIDPVSGLGESLPANLGCIAYMPDPIQNPTQVRIRFVDVTNMNGVNDPTGATGPIQYQTYASNSAQYPIPSSDPARNGAILQLPPVQAVPGSGQNYSSLNGAADPAAATFQVVIASDMFNDPTGFGCSMPSGGLRDRATIPNPFVFNTVASDYLLSFVFAKGLPLARNPQPPDVTFVGSQGGNLTGVAAIGTVNGVSSIGGPGTNFQVPIWAQSVVTGQITLEPNRINNTQVLGVPKDLEIGHWIASQATGVVSPVNSIVNPGRGNVGVPGVPSTQNGGFPIGLQDLLNCLPVCIGPPQQPFGNFLYVVDSDDNTVKVFNGYNFQLLTSLVGIASPEGLGISPNLEYLYVSNFLQNTITQIYANPVNPLFHQVAGVVNVGPGPTAVSVSPGNEDIFVTNFGGNSFSVVDAATLSQRVELSNASIVGPSDVFITNRMLGIGLTNAYMAFITGRFSDNVSVYESDSPSVPENTLNGVVKKVIGGFAGPARGCWNWVSYIGLTSEPGCFVANSTGTTVDELTLQNFTLSPPSGFPGPGGVRNFRIFKSYNTSSVPGLSSQSPTDASIDAHSGLYNFPAVGLNNNKTLCDPALGGGVPSMVLVSYPAAGVVAVFDYNTPALRGMTSVPGCDFLQAYYDQ